MIHIYITGQIANKKKVEQYCVDCLNHFFKGRLKRDIDVEVRITKRLSDNSHGGCYGDSSNIIVELAKGLEINGVYEVAPYKEVLVTLAHELVHVKQHIRKKYTKQTVAHLSESENEAYYLEYVLYDKYWN